MLILVARSWRAPSYLPLRQVWVCFWLVVLTLSQGTTSSFAEAPAGPSIDVWRGLDQRFGRLGIPQRWVNIAGTVSDPDGVESLRYSLNSGPEKALSLGPDLRRLARAGDFNVDISIDDLKPGANSVVITVADMLGHRSSVSVSVDFKNDTTWPLPYRIEWTGVDQLQAVVYEVDGPWKVSPSGIRPVHMDYDRVLAIGDRSWTDYEITVPITIHAIDPSSFGSPESTGPGLGIIMRWQGHSDWGDQYNGPWQPVIGWLPEGAHWWYEFFADGTGQLSLSGEDGLKRLDEERRQLSFGTTYMTRMRVETPTSGRKGGIYRFKIWETDTPEPEDWLLVGQEDKDDLRNGSLLLVAHHADVTFGTISIIPKSEFSYAPPIDLWRRRGIALAAVVGAALLGVAMWVCFRRKARRV